MILRLMTKLAVSPPHSGTTASVPRKVTSVLGASLCACIGLSLFRPHRHIRLVFNGVNGGAPIERPNGVNSSRWKPSALCPCGTLHVEAVPSHESGITSKCECPQDTGRNA